MTAVPTHFALLGISYNCLLFRKDWMDEQGQSLPQTKDDVETS
jgi:hypothetical protein